MSASEYLLTKDLLEEIAAKNPDVPKAAIKRVFDTFLTTTTKSLKKGLKVRINGLGTFTKATRAARKGRNPATGEAIKVKSSKTVRFKPSTTLKGSM